MMHAPWARGGRKSAALRLVRLGLGTLLLLTLVLAGCAKIKLQTSPKPEAPAASEAAGEPAAEAAAGSDAMQYYLLGLKQLQDERYDSAAMSFSQAVSSPEANAQLQRKALFGRAVARLAGASGTQEFDVALEEWRVWVRQQPVNGGEDPALLTPLLERLRFTLEQGAASRAAATRETRQLEAQVRQLQEDKTLLETNILELQEKLRALEELQQEIDIKRKGITTR